MERLNLNNRIKYKNTSLSNSINTIGDDASYDDAYKRLLSHKEVLARILKKCVSEYKSYDIETIKNCIGKDISVSKEAVHQFERVVNENTEDGIVTEGLIKFDIKFTAITPDKEPIQLIINVENQNDYSLGYPLVKRCIYYACRLISAVHGTVFENDDYGKISKVYTIWICTSNFEKEEPRITEFVLDKKELLGKSYTIKKKDYDLLDTIIIRLCKNPNDYDSVIVRFLTYLLSHKFSVAERKRVLSQDYNIKMKEIYEGVDTMSGLGAAIRQEEKIEIAKNMLKSHLPIETIVQCTGLSKEEIEKLK
ncbi:MAG: hypothetical protein HFE57_14015 [Firmicutes bacterium]|jgi:hypothetical protein|nr:hypothetical protein [Bacillota bacterium]